MTVRTRIRRIALAAAALAAAAAALAPVARADVAVRLVVGHHAPGAVGAAVDAAGATVVDRIDELAVEVLEVPAGAAAGLAERLAATAGVDFVQRDQPVRAAAVPSDPMWGTQWGPQKLRLPTAWDTTVGDASVVIAIIDSGVSASHPDLAGGVLPGIDFVDDDADADDVYGHGTLVAGVAAARANNGLDAAGYCWTCSVLPVRVLGDDGTGRATDTAKGIAWATDNGADVINLSLLTSDVDKVVETAVAYARAQGVVVVAAAGNSASSDPAPPASLPGVVGVAGINSDESRYSWSNHGSWVEVAAPSCHVGLTLPSGNRQFCGTSSAAPAVSGVAGLLAAARPGIPGTEIERILGATAVPVGAWVSSGRVDAAAAVAAARAWAGAPEMPSDVVATASPGAADVSWTPGADGGSPVTGYTVTAQPGGASVTAGPTATSATLTGLENGTAYTFTVVAMNAIGTSAPSQPSPSVVPADVPGPPEAVSVVPGVASATVAWAAPADDGGSPVTAYTVSVSPGGLVVEVAAPARSTTVPLEDGVDHAVTVAAKNAVGTGAASAPVSTVAAEPDATRLGGASRVGTSVVVSAHAYDAAPTVVVARADAYADALAAGPLAVAHEAPVLLTPTSGLADEVAAEVARLGAAEAILVGGTGALSPTVEEDLRRAGVGTVRRIAGTDRFDTARLIAHEVGGSSVVVVEGSNGDPRRGWPDAVAASAYAAAAGRPILLVTRDRVPAATLAAVRELGATDATVVGGGAAVPDAVAGALGLGWTRLAGADRYATSVAVADAAADLGADTGRAWIATGRSWPDALAAGPAAARRGAVLLLVDGSQVDGSPVVAAWLRAQAPRLRELVVVGGAGSVADAVAAHLERSAGWR